MKYVWIGLGGFLGATARALLADWAAQRWGLTFPYGTFIANISGSFLLGLLMVVLSHYALLDSPYRLFFAIGFLGAYTTFSTYTYEAVGLLQAGQVGLACLTLFGSLALGLLGVGLGLILGRVLLGPA